MKAKSIVYVNDPSSVFHCARGVVLKVQGGMGMIRMKKGGKVWFALDKLEEKQGEVATPVRVPRFKRGARVRILRGDKNFKGKLGSVVSSHTKFNEPRCMVAIDGQGGSSWGIARIDLERIPERGGRRVPPDPDRKNVARSKRAGEILAVYKSLLGESGPVCCETVADLLVDLGHWADRHEEDMQEIVESARGNYGHETGGLGPQWVPVN